MNKVLLIILDGFGIGRNWGGNALTIARMPQWNLLMKNLPSSVLSASGQAVGLPGHEMGNSEVGHLTIGAGRIVPQDSTKINQAIEDESFFRNRALVEAFGIAKTQNKPIHFLGLLSDGGVHAAYNHLKALLIFAKVQRPPQTLIHLFTDGRDTDPYHAIDLVNQLQGDINDLGTGKIATIIGRFYAMDRDHHLDRTNKTLMCLTSGVGDISNSPLKIVAHAYQNNLNDEFIRPSVIVGEDEKPVGLISNGDPIIFFNFRSDRARQICQALIQKCPNSRLVTFIPYGFEAESKITNRAIPAFQLTEVKNGLASYLSTNGLKQLHIAETEKYAHVTYFFNCGVETAFSGEKRILINSPRVSTYDLAPLMSAEKISQVIIKGAKSGRYQFIVANFANPDMVGHTGNLHAATAALEKLDQLIEEIIKSSYKNETYMVITADHGNCEQMVDPSRGSIDTEHSTNPVPFIVVPPNGKDRLNLRSTGTLADVAPTILEIIGLEKPIEMTGESLIISVKVQIHCDHLACL